MLLTEEQAREKWCPQGRVGETVAFDLAGAAFSENDPQSVERCKCIASDCMMWRFNHTFSGGKCPDPKCPCQEGEENKGYCGLAGKP